jgi:glc operon protein GlcG
MRLISTIDSEDAATAMQEAKAATSALGIRVTIAIVDASGVILRLERDDGAKAHTVDLASRKARTAAMLSIETLLLEQMAKDGRSLSGEVLALAGGAPFLHHGACTGAIGVSGGTSEADHQIAQAAVAALARQAAREEK